MEKKPVFVVGKNSRKVRQRLFQELPSYLRPGLKVLDVGAGDLTTARRMHNEHGVSVDAIDLALPHDNDITCHIHDLNESWPRDMTNRYDVVVSTACIEHIENPYHFMREVSRVLKQGGIAIISTHDINYYWSKLHFMATNHHQAFWWKKDCNPVGEHRVALNEEHLQWAGSRAGIVPVRSFFGNPNLRFIPLIDGIKKIPNWRYLSQEVFVVFRKVQTERIA